MNRSNRRTVFLTAGAGLLFFSAVYSIVVAKPAQAQRPLRLTLGITTPVDHRDNSFESYRSRWGAFGVGSYSIKEGPLLKAGVSYDVKRARREGQPAYSVYLDSGTLIAALDSYYTGMGAAARFERPSGGYIGLGLGMYRLRPRGEYRLEETRIGFRPFLGTQGRSSFFVEIDATITGEVSGKSFSNAAVALGLRL